MLEQLAGTCKYRGHEYPHIPDWGVEFGIASSPYTAEVYFDEVRAYILDGNITQPTVSFNPPNVTISLNSTATMNLTLDKAPNGLSGYNISISLSNPSVAELTTLTLSFLG